MVVEFILICFCCVYLNYTWNAIINVGTSRIKMYIIQVFIDSKMNIDTYIYRDTG